MSILNNSKNLALFCSKLNLLIGNCIKSPGFTNSHLLTQIILFTKIKLLFNNTNAANVDLENPIFNKKVDILNSKNHIYDITGMDLKFLKKLFNLYSVLAFK